LYLWRVTFIAEKEKSGFKYGAIYVTNMGQIRVWENDYELYGQCELFTNR